MVSLDPMQMRIFWYVLAGFLLGFITSTLWEWLYFRKRRLERDSAFAKGTAFTAAWHSETASRAESLSANMPDPAMPPQNVARRKPPAAATNDELLWQTSAYRSPGVFLDSEKDVSHAKPGAPEPSAKGDSRVEPPAAEPVVTPVTSAPPHVAPVEANSSPVNSQVLILPKPVDAADATVKAILLPEPAPPPATVVELPPTNFVRPAINPERNELPGMARRRATLEQTNHEPPSASTPSAETSLPALPPPPAFPAPAPSAEGESATTASVSKRIVPRSTGCPDDLTKIQGIGEAYKRRLYTAGIYTWQQVANSAAEQLRSITKAKPNARPEEWKVRAQELAQKFNRTAAIYDGPLPDDLTKVSGIGPTYADSLYRAGICTYEQLASVTPTELAAILPTPAIGNEFNFPDWIRQATLLANVKQRNMSLLT